MELIVKFVNLILPVIILWLGVWIIGLIPLGETFGKVVRIVVVVLTVIYLLSKLFGIHLPL